jgi:membrane protein DedA with SNARE-associated domain
MTHVTSPVWAYVALWMLLTVDAFVPVVPTQAVMITSGALTVYGGLDLSVTIAVGTAGVLTGDVTCYLLGRLRRRMRAARAPGTPPRMPRLARAIRGIKVPGPARRTARRAGRLTVGLRRPGPVVILLCRFVPGGRAAACYTAGQVGYPIRRFGPYELLAAVAWTTYGAMVGHLGGTAVTQSAWRLVAVAAVAATVFASAGWALALLGPREAATPPAQPRRDGAAARRPDPAAGAEPDPDPGSAHSRSCSMSCRAASVIDPDSDG